MSKLADDIAELEAQMYGDPVLRQGLRDPIRTAYMRGYSRAMADVQATKTRIPSYEEAIAELRAKYEFDAANWGEAITPALIRKRQEYAFMRTLMHVLGKP
jgi:hypothetical protein